MWYRPRHEGSRLFRIPRDRGRRGRRSPGQPGGCGADIWCLAWWCSLFPSGERAVQDEAAEAVAPTISRLPAFSRVGPHAESPDWLPMCMSEFRHDGGGAAGDDRSLVWARDGGLGDSVRRGSCIPSHSGSTESRPTGLVRSLAAEKVAAALGRSGALKPLPHSTAAAAESRRRSAAARGRRSAGMHRADQ